MNLDKNQIIGILLIVAMVVGFQLFGPQDNETTTPKTEQTSLASSSNADPNQTLDSVEITPEGNALESLPEKIITVSNQDLSFKISSKGAQIYDVVLAGYKIFDKTEQVVLLQKTKTSLKTLVNGENISDPNLNYSMSADGDIKANDGPITLTLTAKNKQGESIVQTLKVPATGYLLEHSISGDGLSKANQISFDFKNTLPVTERKHEHYEAYKFNRQYATVQMLTAEEDFDDIGLGESENEKMEESLKWFSFKQRFFTIGVAPQNGINKNATFTSSYESNDEHLDYIKHMSADYSVDLSSTKEYKAQLYIGPNDFYTLKNTGITKFQKNVDMGWTIFGVINTYVILPVFDFLADQIHDFGWVILLLVLFIKIILFPIAFKSYQSMAKMKALKPDLDKLKEKFGEDKQAFGSAQMGLYRQAGVNPLSGCIPQLLQIPILFALFRFFPNAIQLRQESFLWAEDLSSYDALISWSQWIPFVGLHISIFTVLMTITTLINSWYNSQFNSNSAGGNAMAEQMKYMMYLMPLIFFFVLNDYPSGLTFYYFISTLFTIGQQYVANKMIDPEKIRAKIDTNVQNHATGTVKKSRFQQRMEAAMEVQKANQSKKKK